mmetsp:Transcript_46288/g.90372  ORF Transcript_46288/g.90372 Transcript_46288/m.90372 type:complete len:599 (+) Transcript_46288:263-2059(+)
MTRVRSGFHLPPAKRNRIVPLDTHGLSLLPRPDALMDRLHLPPLPPRGGITHRFGRQLSAQHGPLHAPQIFLRREVPRHEKVGDGRRLPRPKFVASWGGGVHATRDAHHGRFKNLGSPAWHLRPNLGGKQSFQFPQCGVDNLLVRRREPVPVGPHGLGGGREHQLQHRAGVGRVLSAARGHVGVDAQQRAAGEAEAVDAPELPVEPELQVEDRDALQLGQLAEVGEGGPAGGDQPLEDVHGHGRHVDVGLHGGAVGEEQTRHGAVRRIYFDGRDGCPSPHGAPAGGDVLHQGLAEALGLVPVQKGRLRPVRLVDEAVHGRQNHAHAQLVGIGEVERLAHGHEDLLVDPLRHAVLLHKLHHAEFVLGVDEGLPLQQHRQEAGHHPQLLLQGEHLRVRQNRRGHVERRGHARRKLEGREPPRQLLHRERHAVLLPLQPLLDLQLLEQVHHVGVRAEEDVQARLDPVAVVVLPRGHLAAQDAPGLVDGGRVPGVREVLGARQPREAAADDGHLLLGRRRRRLVPKLGREGGGLAPVLGLLDPGRRGEPGALSRDRAVGRHPQGEGGGGVAPGGGKGEEEREDLHGGLFRPTSTSHVRDSAV